MRPVHVRKQARAHKAVYEAVERGEIEKPEHCSRCGKGPLPSVEIEGHHADYDKPLEVEWLCLSCHRKRHQEEEDKMCQEYFDSLLRVEG